MEWLTQDVFAMLAAAEAELENLVSAEWWQQNFIALLNITMIDLVLAGDNAIIVGLAASRVAPEMRTKVIFWGITAAVFLRIFFAAITVQLLAVIGLTLAGGLLLLFVCWKMYRQIATGNDHTQAAATPEKPMEFWSAVGAHHTGRRLDVARQRSGRRRRGERLHAGSRHRPRRSDHPHGCRFPHDRRASR